MINIIVVIIIMVLLVVFLFGLFWLIREDLMNSPYDLKEPNPSQNNYGTTIHRQDLGIWKDPKWLLMAGKEVSNTEFAMYHLNQAELYLDDEAKVKLAELKALVEK